MPPETSRNTFTFGIWVICFSVGFVAGTFWAFSDTVSVDSTDSVSAWRSLREKQDTCSIRKTRMSGKNNRELLRMYGRRVVSYLGSYLKICLELHLSRLFLQTFE